MSTGPSYTLLPSATIQLDPYANVYLLVNN